MAQENKVDYSMKSGYDQPMNQQEWERDVNDRQRNIVFPDTMLNETRFYRNLGKVRFTGIRSNPGFIVRDWGLFFGCLCLIDPISSLFQQHAKIHDTDIFLSLFGVAAVLVGIGLTMMALPQTSAARERHKGATIHQTDPDRGLRSSVFLRNA
ncbi:MAG TPA: hypothetical protein VJW55_04890 [Candidatus Angelobacter sp.]|nr:hypothetical protein [Candidatus Angelobacter sp.]